jgi:hypothetical protein
MAELTHDSFFSALPVFTRFEGVTDEMNYRSLPDDWYLALADIVSSTEAIAAGRYKMVNMAGASVISAVLNALDRADYPFVFGGDGACIAIPAAGFERVKGALAAVQSWVAEDLQLSLRTALVPMTDIRAQGLDVRVARFSPNEFVSYAMFVGGGTSWAEKQMKAGNYGIQPSTNRDRPDLTGLSCRWNPISARNGEIVSVIAVPADGGNGAEFQKLVADIIAIAAEQSREGHPVPVEGPDLALALGGVTTEAKATALDGQNAASQAGHYCSDHPDHCPPQARADARGVQCPTLQARCGSQFRLSEIRRRAEDDDRSRCRSPDTSGKPSATGRSGRCVPIRVAPPGLGADDMLRSDAAFQRSHAFYRRRQWRLCHGRRGAFGQGRGHR